MKNHLSTVITEIVKLILLTIIIVSISSCQENATLRETSENSDLQYFKETFTSRIPIDVDPELQNKLKSENNIFALNQAFNRFSWQALVAINWPTDENGEPMQEFTDLGQPTWLNWKEAFQVYQANGKTPQPWGSPRVNTGLNIGDELLTKSDHRIIQMSNTPTQISVNDIDEEKQAFAGRLYDQNGNLIMYEVLMNKQEFDYVMDKKLYNRNGQVNFYETDGNADFPAGNYDDDKLGAIEIKFAWKNLVPGDPINKRYFTSNAFLMNPKTNEFHTNPQLMGMIGMHISQKTPTGKQWVWSTFEHIDNLDQNILIDENGLSNPIHPTLTDPNCETCPINVDISYDSNYHFKTDKHGDYWLVDGDTNKYYTNSNNLKTQSKRMVDIPVRVKQINNEMRAYFKKMNSVWQYYQLIDTQYPLDQNVAPAPNSYANYELPQSVTNKTGGIPNIAFLTNISMETFFQIGNQDATKLIEGNLEENKSGYQIFGTESCMGCHSSATLYINLSSNQDSNSAGQLSGDFSYLLGRAMIDSTLLE